MGVWSWRSKTDKYLETHHNSAPTSLLRPMPHTFFFVSLPRSIIQGEVLLQVVLRRGVLYFLRSAHSTQKKRTNTEQEARRGCWTRTSNKKAHRFACHIHVFAPIYLRRNWVSAWPNSPDTMTSELGSVSDDMAEPRQQNLSFPFCHGHHVLLSAPSCHCLK